MNASGVSIEVRNLRKSWGPVEVLSDVNFGIEPGGFLTLLGPSGCGKSTLLRLICGLDEVSGGQILIDGKDVAGKPAQPDGCAENLISRSVHSVLAATPATVNACRGIPTPMPSAVGVREVTCATLRRRPESCQEEASEPRTAASPPRCDGTLKHNLAEAAVSSTENDTVADSAGSPPPFGARERKRASPPRRESPAVQEVV